MHGTRQKKMTRQFTPEEKAIMRRAKILLKMKRKQIAILLGAEPKQISNFFHYDSKINLLPPKPKLTKKMLMSKKGRIVRYLALQHPRLPLRDLHHLICSLEAFPGKYPSYSTTYRYLKDSGILTIRLKRAQMIRNTNKVKRVDFAKLYIGKPLSFWRYVFWTDEMNVQAQPNGEIAYYRIGPRTLPENIPYNLQVQSGGFSVMFWGGFTSFGFGPLVAFPKGKIDQHAYKKLLEETVVPYLKKLQAKKRKKFVFMQDNAPSHKTKMVMQFLEDSKLDVFNWPPQSPDMNPIETVWAIIKARRKKLYGRATSRDELIKQVKDIWKTLPKELAFNLAMRSPKVLGQTIKARGGHIGKDYKLKRHVKPGMKRKRGEN